MRVAGFDSFVYDRQGSGCAFPSAAHHRSGSSSAGTMKITCPSRKDRTRAYCRNIGKLVRSGGSSRQPRVPVLTGRTRTRVALLLVLAHTVFFGSGVSAASLLLARKERGEW
jgi:hypothetical protein